MGRRGASARGPLQVALVLAIGAWVALTLAGGCSRDDETIRIRRWVEKGARLAERHDLRGVLALTAEDFRAEPGDRGREEAGERLAAAFLYYRRFRLLYPEPAVEIAEDGLAATATFPFVVLREDRSWPALEDLYRDPRRWLEEVGEKADLYQLEVRLKRGGDDWVAHWARLSSLRGAEFIN